jgi:hypothetical protein
VGFLNLFVVDSFGKSGGLAVFWEEDVIVDIQNYSQRHINRIIQNQNDATSSVEIYGFLRTPRRK